MFVSFFQILVTFSLFSSQLELSFTLTSCSPIQIYTILPEAISNMFLFSALASKQKAGGALVESVESLYPEQSSECWSSDLTLFNAQLVRKAFFESNWNVFSSDSYVAELWLRLGSLFLSFCGYLYRSILRQLLNQLSCAKRHGLSEALHGHWLEENKCFVLANSSGFYSETATPHKRGTGESRACSHRACISSVGTWALVNKCSFPHMPVHLLAEHCTPFSVFFSLFVQWLLATFKWCGTRMWLCRGFFASRIMLCRAPGPEPANNESPIMPGWHTSAHSFLKASPCTKS